MLFFEPLEYRDAEALSRVARLSRIERDSRSFDAIARIGGFPRGELVAFRQNGGEGVTCFETGVWPGDEEEPVLIGFVLFKPIYKHRVFEIVRVWSEGPYKSDIARDLIRRVVERAKEDGFTCRAAASDESTVKLFHAYPWTCIRVVPASPPTTSPTSLFVFPAPNAAALKRYAEDDNPTRTPENSVQDAM